MSNLTKEILMSKNKTFVLKPIEVTDDHLDSILVGCFEGGSNYWIKKVEVAKDDYKGKKYASECVAAGGELWIYCDGKHLLTKPCLINGIEQYLDESKYKNWPDGSDAYTYDCILQYALFGEIVYG